MSDLTQVSDKTEPSQHRKRQAVFGLVLSGLCLLFAVWWGLWALLHDEAGVLIVTSRPSGAEVILNRRPTDLITTGFFSDLPADSFLVSLRMDGHRPIPPEQGCRIQPDETTRVTFIMQPIARGDTRELPPVSGKTPDWKWRIVRITSEPEGAGLVADDAELGVQTPATILLEPGMHHIEARWPDGSKAFKNILINQSESPPEMILRPVTYERPARRDTVQR